MYGQKNLKKKKIVYMTCVIALITFIATYSTLQIVFAKTKYVPYANEPGSEAPSRRYGLKGELAATYLSVTFSGTQFANLHFNLIFKYTSGFVALGCYTGTGGPGSAGTGKKYYSDWILDGWYKAEEHGTANSNFHDYEIYQYIGGEDEYVVWVFYLDDSLKNSEITYDLDESVGRPHVYGETNNIAANIDGHFKSLQAKGTSGWVDWTNMDTHDDYPYYVYKSSDTECEIKTVN